jgi:hypothetical protein
MVNPDVLHLARVNPKERKCFTRVSPAPFGLPNTPSHFAFAQHLARDTANVTEP